MRKVSTYINNGRKTKSVYKCYFKIKNCSNVTGLQSEYHTVLAIKSLYYVARKAKNRCNNL
jgi:hypothetical protein